MKIMIHNEKPDARQIVNDADMSGRPEFYSGRGATSSDLNDKNLEKIYQSIEQHHGKDAAQNYVRMVADIPKLSATDFLLSLYKLESHDWKWDKGLLGREKGLYATDIGTAHGTVFSVLFGMSDTDETSYIRGAFLKRHMIEIKMREDKTNLYNEF